MKNLKLFMPFGFPTNHFHRLPMLQMCKVCRIKTSKQRKKIKLHNYTFRAKQLYIVVTVKYVLILFQHKCFVMKANFVLFFRRQKVIHSLCNIHKPENSMRTFCMQICFSQSKCLFIA